RLHFHSTVGMEQPHAMMEPFIKSILPGPTRKNFDWWGGCAAGVRSVGKRKASQFFPACFFVMCSYSKGGIVCFLGCVIGIGWYFLS
ncbi:hypothetical protein, partial [uncultured Bilophila sp.]|uniref:hypothetical protein n=1 Tax=uncultured Bilophila sp. TaxID=529385 RepID=UPI00266FAD6B